MTVASPTPAPGASPIAPSIASMTGFARVGVALPLESGDQWTYELSLKGVNHRFLDLQLRLPQGLEELEMELRRMLKANLARGHVELTLHLDRPAAQRGGYNRELVAAYLEAYREAQREYGLAAEPDLNTIFRLPGVLDTQPRHGVRESAELAASVLREMGPLLAAFHTMREREGAALGAVLHATLDRLTECVDGVVSLRPEIEERYRERLSQRLLAAVGGEFSRQRVLEEIAVLVERSDVSEEIARMHAHIGHFRELLAAGGDVGKKLDFLLQEMNREANTLLSKTAGVAGKGTRITELGLAMKAEIEKAREQIQNLE